MPLTKISLSATRLSTFASVAALLLTACHHNNSSTTSNGGLRLANATSAPLELSAAGNTTTETVTSASVASGTIGDYASLTAQTYTVGVSTTDASLVGSSQTLGIASGTNYTLLAFGREGAVSTFLLIDNRVAPSTGFASLSVVNASGDAGVLDVYLVAPGTTSLAGLAPTYSGVASKSSTTAQFTIAGTYDIWVTATGRPNDVRDTIPGVTVNSGDILTLALTSALSGGLVDSAIVAQGGGFTQVQANPKARVRLVGAFGPVTVNNTTVNATVSADVNGSSLAPVTAPSVGSYALVAGGGSTYDVTVSVPGGSSVPVASLPAQTFASGGDYTILAYGDPSNPSVSVFQDANQPPSSSTAELRLINGAVSEGGLTLNDNFLTIDDSVLYGTASPYGATTAALGSTIQITSPVVNFTTYTATNINILGSSVYTAFVLGTTAQPMVVFAKDR